MEATHYSADFNENTLSPMPVQWNTDGENPDDPKIPVQSTTSPAAQFNLYNLPWYLHASVGAGALLMVSLLICVVYYRVKYRTKRPLPALATPCGIILNELKECEPLQRRPSYRPFMTADDLEKAVIGGPISPTSRPLEAGLRERLDMARFHDVDVRNIPVRKSFKRQQAIAEQMTEKEQEKFMSIVRKPEDVEEKSPRVVKKAARRGSRRPTMTIEALDIPPCENATDVTKEQVSLSGKESPTLPIATDIPTSSEVANEEPADETRHVVNTEAQEDNHDVTVVIARAQKEDILDHRQLQSALSLIIDKEMLPTREEINDEEVINNQHDNDLRKESNRNSVRNSNRSTDLSLASSQNESQSHPKTRERMPSYVESRIPRPSIRYYSHRTDPAEDMSMVYPALRSKRQEHPHSKREAFSSSCKLHQNQQYNSTHLKESNQSKRYPNTREKRDPSRMSTRSTKSFNRPTIANQENNGNAQYRRQERFNSTNDTPNPGRMYMTRKTASGDEAEPLAYPARRNQHQIRIRSSNVEENDVVFPGEKPTNKPPNRRVAGGKVQMEENPFIVKQVHNTTFEIKSNGN